MRTINTTFETFGASVLLLGYKGDSNATEILIDCAEALEEYEGTNAALSITSPNEVLYPGDITMDDNGVVHWVVAERDCAKAGHGSARIDLVNDQNVVVASAEATTIIMKTRMQGIAPDQIADWTEAASVALQELKSALLDLYDGEDVSQANEAARQLAESGRVNAELLRVSAESARVAAESARVIAENARVSAETARSTAETARETAETARAAAETARASAETARVSEFSTIEANAQAALSYIGPSEDSSTASAAHVTGSYFIYDGKLYKATANIDIGDTIEPGTNCAQVPGGAMGEVSELISAFDSVTGNTRNLIQGVLRHCSIESSGAISGSQNNYDLYYAPVTSGKTYHVTTNDSANLVCAFYASVPGVGSTPSYGTRTVQTNKSITAPTTGYIAFRTMADYQYAQIEEGTLETTYIQPLTAEDLVARENISSDNAVIGTLCNNSRVITNLMSFEKWEVGNIKSDGTDGGATETLYPCSIRTVGYYSVGVGRVLVKPNGFYVGIVKYNASTYEKISAKLYITSDEVYTFEDGYVYKITICDATNRTAADYDWMNSVRFEYANEYRVWNVSSSLTSLATLMNPGSYNIDSGVFDNLVDAPSDATHNIYNLYVNSKVWSGAYTLQRLECYDGKIWERTLTTATGAVAFDWKRVDAEYIAEDVFSHQANGNPLYGKKLVTAGDSYTAAVFSGDYASYNGKNFGYYIAQRNNMTFVNSGINGSTMAVSNTEDPTEKSPFSYQRYLNVPEDTDYLTLWFGINDSAYCELGTIDDTENTTFYGAWNKVLQYYLTNRPFMKILIIVTTIGVGNATKCAQIQQAIRDVATKWGYPYMDWMKDTSIPAFFEKEGMSSAAQALRKDAFGWNGPVNGHPNPAWHEYEASIIEARLKGI